MYSLFLRSYLSIVVASFATVLFLLPLERVVAQSSTADAASIVAGIESPLGETIDPDTSMILFYSDACIHCHNEMRWIETIRGDFPDVTFVRFEIDRSQDAANLAYFAQVMAAYDSVPQAWPRTVIGDRVYIGFVPETGLTQYRSQHRAWIGYQNEMYRALERAQETAELRNDS